MRSCAVAPNARHFAHACFVFPVTTASTAADQPYNDPLRKEKRLSRHYIVGLLLIIMLATVTHVIMGKMLLAEQNSANTVNMAGNQAMLSQRIMQLTYRYMLSRDAQETERFRKLTNDAIEDMRAKHQTLLTEPPSPSYQRATDAIYFDLPHELDLRLRTFLGAAQEITQTEPARLRLDDPLMQYVGERAVEPLLETLNLAVLDYVQASRAAIGRMHLALWLLYAALVITIVLEGVFIFRPAFSRLMQRTRELNDLARTDPLTGCHNRRSFVQFADIFHERVKRYDDPCAVIVMDIDHFKKVNDTHGHAVGDLVIKALAQTCLTKLRRADVFGRLGGEEFAVLLPGNTEESALDVAEKLRIALSETEIALPDDGMLRFTVSVGIAAMSPIDESPFEALNRADAALYRAKDSGRNRCVSDSGI